MLKRSVIFFLLFILPGLEVYGQLPQSDPDFEEAFGFPWAQGARPYIEGSYGPVSHVMINLKRIFQDWERENSDSAIAT